MMATVTFKKQKLDPEVDFARATVNLKLLTNYYKKHDKLSEGSTW